MRKANRGGLTKKTVGQRRPIVSSATKGAAKAVPQIKRKATPAKRAPVKARRAGKRY